MTIRSERIVDRLLSVPASSGRLTAYNALDAGRAFVDLTSNPAHLCQESVRPLFFDAGTTATQLQANDLSGYTGDVARDYTHPTASDVTHVWEEIAFTRKSARRFGPFSISPDEGDRPTNAVPRKVRVVVYADIPASVRAGLCAVITQTSSPEDIRTGRYIDAAEATGLAGAGLVAERFDLEPTRIVDGAYPRNRSLQCAPTGATESQSRTFYVWVGWSVWAFVPTTFDVLTISGFERR